MPRTTKPCPACKEVVSYRKADDVCLECQKLISEAREQRERLNAKGAGKMDAVAIPKAAHWLQTIYYANRGEYKLQRAFLALAVAIGEKNSAKQDWNEIQPLIEKQDSVNVGSGADLFRFKPGVLKAFRAVYAQVIEDTYFAYRDGKEAGQNLLRGLASGDMTVKEFNRRAGHKDDE